MLFVVYVALGGWLSYYSWAGDSDEVSLVSGLSRREVDAVQNSWAPVSRNLASTGNELLRRYFNSYPEAKEYFSMVRGKTEEEYSQNPQFKAHVINLMTALNLGVTMLHQPEQVAAIMNKLGKSHGRRKIKEQNFYDLKITVVKLLSDVLKPDSATLNAWSKTVDFWYKHIFKALNSGEESR